MIYLELYLMISSIIGSVMGAYLLYRSKNRLMQSARRDMESMMDEEIKNGHIQKELDGQKKVYYGKNDRGKLVIESAEEAVYFMENYPYLNLLLFFIFALIDITLTWPLRLYSLTRKK